MLLGKALLILAKLAFWKGLKGALNKKLFMMADLAQGWQCLFIVSGKQVVPVQFTSPHGWFYSGLIFD